MRTFRALLLLTVVVHAAVLVARVISTIHFSALMPVPIEGPGIYAIWKVQHGYPLYEWPTRPFFGLTLYNFLFYVTYAWILRLVGVTSAALPVGTHLLTIVFTAIGAVAQYVATLIVLRRVDVRVDRGFVAATSFLIWFGAGVIGRWALVARADVAAIALAVTALALILASLDGPSLVPVATAGVVFYLAWAFKQSVVGILAGVCVFELFVRRSLRCTLAIAVPFALLCLITLVAGGAAYRFNILEAPRLTQAVIPWLAIYWYRSIAIPNVPVWLAAGAGVLAWSRRSRRTDPRWHDAALTLVVCTIVTTFPLDVLLLAKGGSSLNHTFESWVVTALFAVVAFSIGAAAPNARPRMYAMAAASMIAPLAFGLLMLNGGPSPWLQAMTTVAAYDAPRFGDEAVFQSRIAVRDRLKRLPKPIFIDDEIFGQPWFANDDRYPAVVLDHVFYDVAAASGHVERDGVLSLVDDRYFATVIVEQPPWMWTRRAVAAGYVEAETLSAGDLTWVVFVRSDTAPRKVLHKRRPTIRKTP